MAEQAETEILKDYMEEIEGDWLPQNDEYFPEGKHKKVVVKKKNSGEDDMF